MALYNNRSVLNGQERINAKGAEKQWVKMGSILFPLLIFTSTVYD